MLNSLRSLNQSIDLSGDRCEAHFEFFTITHEHEQYIYQSCVFAVDIICYFSTTKFNFDYFVFETKSHHIDYEQ